MTANSGSTSNGVNSGGRERPLSPHISIYKPQITSIMSIMHRITGIVNVFALAAMVWFVVSVMLGETAFDCFVAVLTSPVGYVALFGWFLTLFYHLFNGVRHLFWDIGRGFALSSVAKTGISVLLATLASALLVSYLVWG